MRIILFFFVTLLFGNEKLFIAKFENLQPYYYQNQIVNLKLKIITAKDGNLSIKDENNKTYPLFKKDQNYYSNIQFKLIDKFPTFEIVFRDNNLTDEMNLTINSKIKKLYPPKNFSHLIADNLKIVDRLLTNYDDKYNIVYWTIIANNSDVRDFKLGFKDEKLFFLDKNETTSKYAYSALVPLNKNNFSFSYFDLKDEKYKTLSFYIKLKNEIISTQLDINPMSDNKKNIINLLLLSVGLIWFLLYFFRKKWIYIVLIVLTILSAIFFNLPKKEIVLPQNTKIHLLPFDNSTIFVVTSMDTKVKVLKTKNGWKKIEFNKNIGWVKDE